MEDQPIGMELMSSDPGLELSPDPGPASIN